MKLNHLLLILILFSFELAGANSINMNYPSYRSSNIQSFRFPGSSNTYFFGTEWNNGRITYSAVIPESGLYSLQGLVSAPDGGSNSFFLSTHGVTRKTIHLNIIENPTFQNFGSLFLPEGPVEIILDVRESLTKVSDLRLELNPNTESLDQNILGVPETTTENSACFIDGEKDFLEQRIQSLRVQTSGCNSGVVAPRKEIESFRPYEYGTNGTIYNCERVRKKYLYSRPERLYLEELIDQVDHRAESTVNGSGVQCAVDMYYIWARENAMSKIVGSGEGARGQSRLDRMWRLGSIAASYLKSPHIQERAHRQSVGSNNKDTIIKTWVNELATQVRDEAQSLRDDKPDQFGANTMIWRGFALMSSAVLTQDRSLYNMSSSIFMQAMLEIVDDASRDEDKGFLPHELSRRSRALHYHAFALLPLSGLSFISQAYQCDRVSTSWRRSQVARLARKTIQGKYDPDVFKREVLAHTGESYNIRTDGTNPNVALLLLDNLRGFESSYNNITNFVSYQTGQTVSSYDSQHINLGGELRPLVDRINALKSQNSATLNCN